MRDPWSDQELDAALRALHADEPPMADATFHDRRAAILAAAMADRPVGAVPARDVLPARDVVAVPRHRPLLAAAAVLLVVGVSVVLLPLLDRMGDSTASMTTSAPAPDELPSDPVAALEALAGRCADPSLGEGQYLFHEYTLDGGSSGYDEVTRTWIPGDQQDEWLRRTHQDPRDPTPPEELRAPYGGFIEIGSTDSPWGSPTPQFYAERSRDPRQLYDDLVGDRSPEIAYRVRWIVLLPPPADLRAAMLRAIALHPSITVNTRATTPDGRRVVTVTVPFPDSSEGVRLSFDAADCQVAGSSNTEGGLTLHVRTAVVNELGQVP